MTSFQAAENGNITIITALSATVLAGIAGAALLMGQDARRETQLQAALDAGVLAGTALPDSATSRQRISAAEKSFYANIEEAVFGAGSGGASFAADTAVKPVFTVSRARVSGTASARVENTLGASLGITSAESDAFSQAEKMRSEPVCVLALDKFEKGSLYVYGNADFNVDDCAVQANSANAQAMQMDGRTSSAKATQFGVTGNYGGNASNWNPPPIAGTEPIADPYAGLPVPEPGSCLDVAAKLQSSTFELGPGTYCGGLEIKSGASVTLKPGVYVFKDGPLKINSGATVTGNEVLLAYVGANACLDMKSDSTLIVTSPVAGRYKNIQMLSDRDLSASRAGEEWTTILSGARLEFDGVIYLPEQNFWASSTAHDTVVKGSSPTMTLVVDTVWAQGNARIDLKREDRRKSGGDGIVATFGYGARLVR